jgi:hypothetical protein
LDAKLEGSISLRALSVITRYGNPARYDALLAPTLGIPLSPLAALVFSVSSFHGHGFFSDSNIPLDAPITVMAAAGAIVGLLIAISFIATRTQRFFSR